MTFQELSNEAKLLLVIGEPLRRVPELSRDAWLNSIWLEWRQVTEKELVEFNAALNEIAVFLQEVIMPDRIQRQRTRGWKMPANTVYVGRPSKWGNQFRVTQDRTRGEAMSAYEIWLEVLAPTEFREAVKQELRGKNLACWCRKGARCHADLLLKLANEESGEAAR